MLNWTSILKIRADKGSIDRQRIGSADVKFIQELKERYASISSMDNIFNRNILL